MANRPTPPWSSTSHNRRFPLAHTPFTCRRKRRANTGIIRKPRKPLKTPRRRRKSWRLISLQPRKRPSHLSTRPPRPLPTLTRSRKGPRKNWLPPHPPPRQRPKRRNCNPREKRPQKPRRKPRPMPKPPPRPKSLPKKLPPTHRREQRLRRPKRPRPAAAPKKPWKGPNRETSPSPFTRRRSH